MGTFRQLARSPFRLAATVLALALSVAALGVLAVPSVSSQGLRALASEDRLAHLSVDTTPIADPSVLAAIPGVTAAEARVAGTVRLPSGDAVAVVGVDPDTQSVNVVEASQGRLPRGPGEASVTPALVDAGVGIGDQLPGPSGPLEVVGIGTTAAFDVDPAVVVAPGVAAAVAGEAGPNRVLLRLEDPTEAALAEATDDLRGVLAEQGATFTGFPESNVDGAHPLEAEITMVAVMIGFLGVVAGIVALVLLGTTTAAIITDRSSETAVLRAMGSGPRATRAALRRLALATAAIAALVGVPLGIAVANVIARMVLERFAGITPGIVFSAPLALVSVAFLLVGARLVSAPAARRAVARPLASALRDHDGMPYGGHWWQRAGTRVGGWLRLPEVGLAATRGPLRRPGRAAGLTLQVTCGVAAVLIVASLGTSLAEFGEAELEPWAFDTVTVAVDASGGWPAGAEGNEPEGSRAEETGLWTEGTMAGTELDVFGLAAGTSMLDTTVTEGRWPSGAGGPSAPGRAGAPSTGGASRPPEVVVTAGFARHRDIAVGDTVGLTLPSGTHEVEVVGLHRLRAVAAFAGREDLAALLGRPGEANVVWSRGGPGPLAETASTHAVTSTTDLEDLSEEDRAGRSMIMGIFWAIGVVVVGVAAIGLASSLHMLVHERRRELATLRAGGAPAGVLRRLVVGEMLPVALLGAAAGAFLAHLGARALMAGVESAEGLEIGYAYAASAVLPVVAAAVSAVVLLALGAARTVRRRSPAATLRAAA